MKPATRRGHRLAIAAVILGITGIRLLIAARLPLAFDEAYYWRWSQDLSLAYPDHPPLVAWLIRLGVVIAGSTELGVRLCFVLLSGIGMALVYRIARLLDLSRVAATVAMLTATCLPAVAVGSLLATPDLPLGICTLGSVLLLLKISRGAIKRRGLVLLALTICLGFYAKLAAGLLLLTVGAVGVFVPTVRGRLLSREGLIALVAFAVLVTPLAAAELRAGQSAAFFQLSRLDPASLDVGWLHLLQRTATYLGEIISGQLGLLTPFVAWLALAAWFVRPRSKQTVILTSAWWIPIGVTCCAALFTHPEQNWAALGHPLAAVLAVWLLTAKHPARARGFEPIQKHRHKLLAATVASALVPTLIIHAHALSPFLPLPPEKDPVGKLWGYASLDQLPKYPPLDSRPQAIFTDNYALASQTAWALRSTPSPVASCDRPSNLPLPGGTWLILDERDDLFNAAVPDICRSTRPLRNVEMRGPNGRILRRVEVSLGFGCKYECAR